MAKRYYWIKLKDDFFRQLPIKKLRCKRGGDTYTIIYQKMLLLTTKTDGVIDYDDCSEAEFVANLALDLDEKECNVKATCQFLLANGLMVKNEDGTYSLPATKDAVGSETAAALRSREYRKKTKGSVKEVADVLQCNINEVSNEQKTNVEIETRDRERERDKNKKIQEVVAVWNDTKTMGLVNSVILSDLEDLLAEHGQDTLLEAIKVAGGYKNLVKPIAMVAKVCANISNGVEIKKTQGKRDIYAEIQEELRKEAENNGGN